MARRILLFTFVGILLLLGGVYLAYLGFSGINDGQAWFLLPSILLFGGSGFILYRAGKSDSTVVIKGHIKLDDLVTDKPGFESTLKRNNAFDAEWGKTNDARNRLKMLELSAGGGKK